MTYQKFISTIKIVIRNFYFYTSAVEFSKFYRPPNLCCNAAQEALQEG